MKIQIRRCCFETNSSSVHTLVLCNDKNTIKDYFDMATVEVKEYVRKNGIIFKNDYFEDFDIWSYESKKFNDSIEQFKAKLQMLYTLNVNDDTMIRDLIDFNKQIKNIGQEIGVHAELIIPNNADDLHWGETCYPLTNLDDTELASFLFDENNMFYIYSDEGGCINPYEGMKIPKGYEVFTDRS